LKVIYRKGVVEIMADNRIYDLIDHWDELGWYDRKRIDWERIKDIHQINYRFAFTLVAGLSILGVLIVEQHLNHMTILVSTIVLSFFYAHLIAWLVRNIPST
jgi:hypothetical protein